MLVAEFELDGDRRPPASRCLALPEISGGIAHVSALTSRRWLDYWYLLRPSCRVGSTSVR